MYLSSTKLSWLVCIAAIWVPVIYLLGAQWSVYPEYQYGWAAPFLCLYLAGQRVGENVETLEPGTGKVELSKTGERSRWDGSYNAYFVALILFGLVYWGMRILQEANPLWRLASYGLAGAAVAMTLLAVYLTQGGRRAINFAFPVAFFLVAVPWPTPVEDLIIQTLTRFNANLVVETLNLVGIPALLHGNVIEIGTGMVGIDEACSGIRSFQATLMIALFFGGGYQLNWARRGWLLAAGPGLALVFNFARTLVLVLVAAHSGLPAMEKWHDPTGVALLLGCFLCLWGVALWLKRINEKQKIECDKQKPLFTDHRSPPTALPISVLTFCLVVWSAVVAVSTEAWFHYHEVHGNGRSAWTVRWPAKDASFHTNQIPNNALKLLQCDQNSAASWMGVDGVFWQGFYLRWLPADSFYGRAKVALSKTHNPAICLTASGMKIETHLDPVTLPVRTGFKLSFDRFVFNDGERTLFVFFAQTEDMTSGDAASLRSTHLDRLRAALAGSRNYGQNNFEVALTGPTDAEAALRRFSARLPELIETPAAQSLK